MRVNVEDIIKIDISEGKLEEWRFIGLNNFDFITSGFYKDDIQNKNNGGNNG